MEAVVVWSALLDPMADCTEDRSRMWLLLQAIQLLYGNLLLPSLVRDAVWQSYGGILHSCPLGDAHMNRSHLRGKVYLKETACLAPV